MKILLVIDHFGSGGAHRQIVELACGLSRRGHAVEMFVYFPQYRFFRERLDAQRIPVHAEPKSEVGSLRVIARLAGLMRNGGFDVTVSFLSTANVYAELAGLAAPRIRLVVSERSSFCDDKSAFGAVLRRLLHLLADRVVANSETQARWLLSRPWLRSRVSCIPNGVNLEEFQPAEPARESAGVLRLLGVGRVGPEKNLQNLIVALARFEKKFGHLPEVTWVGLRDVSRSGQRYCEQLDALLARLPTVQRRWQWLGLQSDIPGLLREHDALVHPSLYEGSPNAVCEALAAGKPVLASAVCDHPLLVADGKRGFLFDPRDPDSIVTAIAKFAELGADGRRALGRQARAYAEAELSIDKMVGRYEALFGCLLGGRSYTRADTHQE